MVQESLESQKPLAFYQMVIGNAMDIDQEILRRLKQRLRLTQVNAVDNCDVIMAFVPIVSRAGTNIASALQKIPRTGQPIVLMGLHFTFDESYVAPESKWNINRDDVFAVDLLCYEDLGLLRSLRNDQALKAVTDHLISIGGSPNTQQFEETRSERQNHHSTLIVLILFIIVILVAIIIGVIIYTRQWKNQILPTPQPNTTINTNNTSY